MDTKHVPTLLAAVFCACCVLSIPAPTAAETIEVGPDEDLATILAGVTSGDIVLLADGTYELGTGVDVTLDGGEANRIVIEAVDGARPLLTADSGDAVMQISGTHFRLSGLEFSGPNAGVILDAENALLERLVFSGGTTGVACTRCIGVGVQDSEFTGLDGDAALRLAATRDSSITHNWIHDLPGETNGIVLAAPSSGSVVSDNVVSNVGGIGISTGDDPTAAEANLVAANWVESSGGHGVQLVGRASIVNNIVVGAGGAGLFGRLGAEGQTSIDVLHNTVVDAADACMRAEDWALSSGAVIVANNALYCDGGTAIRFDDGGGFVTVTGNVYVGNADRPGDSLMGNGPDDFEDAATNNFYPADGSALLEASNSNQAVTTDFNGSAREQVPDVGAYERVADSNPIPNPAGGFKPDQPGLPGDAGDAGTSDMGTTDGGVNGNDGGADGGSADGGSGSRAQAGGAKGFEDRDDKGCQCGTSPAGDASLLMLVIALFGTRLRRR